MDLAMVLRPFRRPRNATTHIMMSLLLLSVLPYAQGQEADRNRHSPFPVSGQGTHGLRGSAGRVQPLRQGNLRKSGDSATNPLDLPQVPAWYRPASVAVSSIPASGESPQQGQESTLQLAQQPGLMLESIAPHPPSGSILEQHSGDTPLPSSPPELSITGTPFPNDLATVPQEALPVTPPPAFSPWWNEHVTKPLAAPESIQVDLGGLMQSAVHNSRRVLAVEQSQWIRGEEYLAAKAGLDPTLFLNTRYDDTSDPVGDQLTTGGPNRLLENRWSMNAGVRGQTSTGADYSVGQQLGHLNSNSLFIAPNDQGTARLGVAWNQPLMRNRQIDQNRSLILTTRIESDVARAEYMSAVVTQLGRIGDAYWELYFHRATLLQRYEHLRRAEEVAKTLNARDALDSRKSQILRAEVAQASRQAAITRVAASITSTEARIRSLINTPGISDNSHLEIIPVQTAAADVPQFNADAEVAAALQRNPEIAQLRHQLSVARVQFDLAKNQVKPRLDLVIEGYVAGLQGNSNVPRAWADQFSRGQPGYAGGLEFEVPYKNRAAEARLRQQAVQLHQIENLIAERQANVQAEVESALARLEAAREETAIRQRALAAVNEELHYQEARWKKLQGDPNISQFQLDELLGTQDRLFQQEQAVLSALTDLNRAVINVQVATGALVRFSR